MMQIVETFKGISGEVCLPGQGIPTFFIRLAGCNLNCEWCDTKHARSPGSAKMAVSPTQMAQDVLEIAAQHVLFTGGEPLLQVEDILAFIAEWRWLGRGLGDKTLTIETNGSICVDRDSLDACNHNLQVSVVADYKLLSSGERGAMCPDDWFLSLRPTDFVKFVVGTQEDLALAIRLLTGPFGKKSLREFTPAISPVLGYGVGENAVTAQQIVDVLWAHGLTDVLLSVQIHKFLDLR